MASLRDRVVALEIRWERLQVLEEKQDTISVYVKCIAYLLAAVLTHVVGSPWANALSSLLNGS
jgi:hypothetical protein